MLGGCIPVFVKRFLFISSLLLECTKNELGEKKYERKKRKAPITKAENIEEKQKKHKNLTLYVPRNVKLTIM